MARERDLRKILNFDTCVDQDIKHTHTCHIMRMPSVYKDRLAVHICICPEPRSVVKSIPYLSFRLRKCLISLLLCDKK
jgi:hypothetical protein